MFSQPPESECYPAFSCVGLYIAINNTLSWSINSSHASYLTLDNNVITAIVVVFHKTEQCRNVFRRSDEIFSECF